MMKKSRITLNSLVLLALLVCFLVPARAEAQSLAGRWKGTWTSQANARHREHRGPLQVRLVPKSDGSYQGTFSGRFAMVIPFFYRAPVVHIGDQLVSTRRLGPLGEYRMQLQPSGWSRTPNQMNGSWTAAGESGQIMLQRR